MKVQQEMSERQKVENRVLTAPKTINKKGPSSSVHPYPVNRNYRNSPAEKETTNRFHPFIIDIPAAAADLKLLILLRRKSPVRFCSLTAIYNSKFKYLLIIKLCFDRVHTSYRFLDRVSKIFNVIITSSRRNSIMSQCIRDTMDDVSIARCSLFIITFEIFFN